MPAKKKPAKKPKSKSKKTAAKKTSKKPAIKKKLPAKMKKSPVKKAKKRAVNKAQGKKRSVAASAQTKTQTKTKAKIPTRTPAPTRGFRRDESQQSRSGGQAGDLQGLSAIEGADSESVDELIEEGNAFEADVVAGVEAAGDSEEQEVHTHEVPEDDVPDEYLDNE